MKPPRTLQKQVFLQIVGTIPVNFQLWLLHIGMHHHPHLGPNKQRIPAGIWTICIHLDPLKSSHLDLLFAFLPWLSIFGSHLGVQTLFLTSAPSQGQVDLAHLFAEMCAMAEHLQRQKCSWCWWKNNNAKSSPNLFVPVQVHLRFFLDNTSIKRHPQPTANLAAPQLRVAWHRFTQWWWSSLLCWWKNDVLVKTKWRKGEQNTLVEQCKNQKSLPLKNGIACLQIFRLILGHLAS